MAEGLYECKAFNFESNEVLWDKADKRYNSDTIEQTIKEFRLDFSPRDGISVIRYALKRLAQSGGHPLAEDDAWREAVERCLGEDALDLQGLSKARERHLGGEVPPMGLGDFFLSPDDPLNPDARDGEEDE